MTIIFAGICASLVLLLFFQMWLHDRERIRHQNAMMTTQARLVALADKAALSVADSPTMAPIGKVTYMDERREAELDAAQT